MTDQEIAQARRIWADYQQTHDLSERIGDMAGIDPATGEVWIGEWVTDIALQRKARGLTSPLLFERIGAPTGLFKGGHHVDRRH
jgi:hypothetical protein